jgi:FtsZ-binding cell division protein ZapB
MGLEKIDTLESSLGRLLDGIDVLKAEKHEWKGAIGLRELEIKGLKKKIKQMGTEKEAVRKKVDLLLKRLEGLTPGE